MPEQHLGQNAQLSPVASAIVAIIALAVMILMIASMWKVFTKAGEPGWASIVPIYNAIVILKIAGKPLWWILLFIIPVANLIVGILTIVSFAERFGKSTGFVFGLLFLPFIFYPILAFGDAQYLGPKSVDGGGALAPA